MEALANYIQQALDLIVAVPEWLITAKQAILEKTGTPGLIALIILCMAIAVQVVIKLVRLSLNILRYVVVPSIATTFLLVIFTSLSLSVALPASVSFFSIVLLFKG
ncbi:MAG: hypothetical protein JW763_02725 [candidate division Zixibacteria bacterium]|nr:hypothetical protein [candidate division Zixibacteria bacterium]